MLVDKKNDVLKITDYLSNSQFRRTGIYNEFYKRVGVERQVAFAMDVAPQLLVTCALSRTNKDFNERDRAVLSHLSPHLIAAFRNTRILDRVTYEVATLRDRLKLGHVVVTRRGDVRFINPRAAEMLGAYFGHSNEKELPPALRAYLDSQVLMAFGQEYYEPLRPIEFPGEFGTLQVQISCCSNTDDVTVILEEYRESTVRDFQLPGLTPREGEILFWISKGKTDPDIGRICKISVRTVQKHVENVFIKLGVETRTAAAMAAIERSRSVEG
jgi:DNA-binding CsgD family transcriptional regulator